MRVKSRKTQLEWSQYIMDLESNSGGIVTYIDDNNYEYSIMIEECIKRKLKRINFSCVLFTEVLKV